MSHTHRRLVIGALIGVLVFNVGGAAQAAPPAPGAQPQVTLTADGLIVEWFAPEPVVDVQADGAVIVKMMGYDALAQPDQPQVPMASALVALPPGAQPSFEIEMIEEGVRTLPGPLALEKGLSGLETVELKELGLVRGARLARLTFYPARPEGEALRITTHVRVRVKFNAPSLAPAQSAASADAMLRLLKTAVVNPRDVQAERLAVNQLSHVTTQTGAPGAIITVNAAGMTQITYAALLNSGFPVASVAPQNLHLTRGGIESALEWEGDGDANFEPGERLLFFAEPRFSRWTASDGYVLSAEAAPGLRMASRSASPSSLPAGYAWRDHVVESNTIYTPDYYRAPIPPGRDGDRWVWDEGLTRPGSPTATYNFNMPPVNAARPARLTVWLIGNTDVPAAPDHRVVVALNNQTLGAVEWDGKQAVTATLPVTAGVLLSGGNALQLTLPGLPGVAVEGTWLDAFALNYAADLQPSVASLIFETASQQTLSTTAAITLPTRLYLPLVMKDFMPAGSYTVRFSVAGPYRAYDVTDASQPVRLTDVSITGNTLTFGTAMDGARRFAAVGEGGLLNPLSVRVPSALQSVSGADYVIIAPAAFSSALSSLVALRQSQGLSVTVENVQAIYDAYDYGRPTPDAIRAYLADAYANWTPRPTYVLLVGDGTSDPRRYRSNSFTTLLPPYLADVDPWAGETAADNRYVTLDGNDALPDMLIGRLPVNTLTETQTVVNKIVQYEAAPPPGLWNAAIAFTADDADEAGDFAAQSDLLASAYITSPYTAEPLYLMPPTSTVTATQQALLSRWNTGAGLLFFKGHSSIHQWATERLFHLDDVASLTNGARLPVVVELTCFTGTFQTPGLPTLDEALVRHPNGGAVAVWGATGLGVADGHALLAEGFLQSLFQDGNLELGQAALAGKLRLAASATAPDLLDTFTLLGDPATRYHLTLNP